MAAPIDNPFSFPVTHFGQFMDHWSHNHEHRALQYLDNANLFVAGMTGLAAILAVGATFRGGLVILLAKGMARALSTTADTSRIAGRIKACWLVLGIVLAGFVAVSTINLIAHKLFAKKA